MKIAVTTENDMIFQHFGKCKSFTVFQVENGEIKSKSLLDAGESGHSALATLLAEQNVSLLICGGIGGGAKDALRSAGIELVAGAQGNVERAVRDYLAGKLVNNPEFTCNHHGEGHSCSGTCAHHQ
ncbi:MAG TPA: NifB/NifX family molybdenum-iron cluster-binding protein [Oscillospiraceae bacterium]|nr:NifB/NifX family molybdenum-iron cluster-binding protein [Oscillospiraceae bacterium]